MSTTKALVDPDVTAIASIVNWRPADKSDFVQIDSVVKNDGTREAVYQKVTDVANAEYLTTVRIGFYPSKDGSESSVSLKMSAWINYTDSVSGVVTYKPITCTIAVKGPGTASMWDITFPGNIELLTNAMSWLLPVTGTSLGGAAADLLKFGVVTGFNTLAD